jgi:hypothetical protein
MKTFELLPKNWHSSNYLVFQDGSELTEFKFLSGPERSVFTLGGGAYTAHKEKWDSPNFFLHQEEMQLARAEKPSALSETFTVEYQGRVYGLKKSGMNRFALSEQDREVGFVAKQGWSTKKATAELPDELPLPVCAFIIWLVLLMWKREEDTSDSVTVAVSG